MDIIEKILHFHSPNNVKKLIATRVLHFIFLFCIILGLLYSLFLFIIHLDYCSLKRDIESEIMEGYSSVYDYKTSVSDNKHMSDFHIISICKNSDYYILTKYYPTGITHNSSMSFCPDKVYEKALEALIHNFSADSHRIYAKFDKINKLWPPSFHENSKRGYNNTHATSLFHVLDSFLLNDEVLFGMNYRKYINVNENIVCINVATRFMKIHKNHYCYIFSDSFKRIIFSLIIGLSIFLFWYIIFKYIPNCKRYYFLAGKIWITEFKDNAIIFKMPVFKAYSIIQINNSQETINSFIFSKGQKLIRLSNGTLKQINYISNTEIIIDSTKYYSLQTHN